MGRRIFMTAKEIGQYFLNKDHDKSIFTNNIIILNNRKCYDGNVKLNKYLFLAQVVYLAKNNKKLFDDDFVAYINGPVIKSIIESFSIMIYSNKKVNISKEISEFLDKIYVSLENATVEELVEISHEDPEWIKLKDNTYNAPIMNLENNVDEYKIRYKGLIQALKI